jgi:bacteriocin biosynthesis cyclodehydratase domain-containing protein
MPGFDQNDGTETVRFNKAFGIFILGPDEVEFRTGSTSGTAYVVSDSERRGLLGPIIEKLVSLDPHQRRPWNQTELELLEEILPQLRDSGVVESSGVANTPNRADGGPVSLWGKPLAESRIAIVGHGVLGRAVQRLLSDIPCGSITVIESSSVAEPACGGRPTAGAETPSESTALVRLLSQPKDADQWVGAISDHDWVVAAQDSFEPEELAALNKAALTSSTPWSLVCFDGYEGWVGPTFLPHQTACFTCFCRRLLAASAEPKHIFRDPGVKVHRPPAAWSVGSETGAWVSLITSIFALELIAATRGESFTLNQMLIVHRLNLSFQRETVLRLPRCPDCGSRRDAPRQNVFSHILSMREKKA